MVWGIYLIVPRHRLGVNMVVLDDLGRVLLLKHLFHPYAPWGLPGGWLNRDEDPTDCGLRELREETGLTAVPGPILLAQRDKFISHVGIIFMAYVQPGPITLNGEIMEAGWFAVDTLPDLLTPTTRQAIDTAVKLIN